MMAFPFAATSRPSFIREDVVLYGWKKNSLSESLDSTEYRAACKRLLSEKPVLARIVKACIPEFKDIDVKDIESFYIEGTPYVSAVPLHRDTSRIVGMNTEDASVLEGTAAFDILFHVLLPKSRERVKVFVDLEAQNKFYPGYPLESRMVYNMCRMVSRQYGTEFKNSRYGEIKKCYSIWICNDPAQECANSMNHYHITEERVAGNMKRNPENYDLISGILITLGGEKRERYEGIFKMLDVLLSNTMEAVDKKRILEEEYKIPMTEKFNKEVEDMCNLSMGVYESGHVDGYEDGYEKAMFATARRMLKRNRLTIEEIAEDTGLSVEKVQALKKEMESLR